MAFAENYNANLASQVCPLPARQDAPDRPPQAGDRPPVRTPAAAASGRRVAGELRLPCMVFAAVGVPPACGEALETALDVTRRAHGVIDVVNLGDTGLDGGGVAVIARGYWLARQALARFIDQCRDGVHLAAPPPDARRPALANEAPTASSAACTAQLYRGHLRLWMGGSDPIGLRIAAARLAGVGADQVDLRLLGNLDGPHGMAVLHPAIFLAQRLQPAPVQIIIAHELPLHRSARASDDAGPVRPGPSVIALAA
jgi:hypothetical protein